MTNGQKYTPMLKAGGLWAKTSAKGGRYLSGRLGGVKVLILENRDRKTDDDPSHILFFAEAAPRQDAQERQGSAQERGDGQRGASPVPPERQRPSTPQRSGFAGHAGAGADWQAPLQRDGAARQPAGGDDDVPPWER